MNAESNLDAADRALINHLQGGFPIVEEPFAEVAKHLDMDEEEVTRRLSDLLARGVLTRFGPMYHAERLGGGLTLAAMKVPDDDFDAVAEAVNAQPEVAHNYARDHAFNMWFVIATETPERIAGVIAEIE
ncbi:MAG TPA: Lrp/AsnC family transcriptional regulator, partial [Rhodospirillales bacterium]|nr:Lrp/AsnC family transcriptional regulator [Rhodospirillales bacterium]